MKIAILTDSHFGFKKGSDIFSDHFQRFYEQLFFPYLEEHKITHILHLGDLFDNRRSIHIAAVKRARDMFFSKLGGYECKFIIGNHDTFFRDTLSVNSPSLLIDKDMIVDVPQEWMGIDLIPWINSENEDSVAEFIKNSTNRIAGGHFDLAGFYMNKGVKSQYTARSRESLNKYEKIFSGHFHTRSDDGHVYYIGAPYEMTWADYDDPRGFVVYDTETQEHDYIDNLHTIYAQCLYNNGLEYLPKDKIVKLIVERRENYSSFELLTYKLIDQSIDVKIIEVLPDDVISVDVADFEVIDTEKYLLGWVDRLESDIHTIADKKSIKRLLSKMYKEAMT